MASNEVKGRFKAAAIATIATIAFGHVPLQQSNSDTALMRQRRKKHSKTALSFELSKNRESKPPHQVAAEGSLDELKSLIEEFGLSIKEQDENGSTLLHSATRSNQIPVMQYLIESGISLDATDNSGNTALHVAVDNGHVDAMHLLLSSGADDKILNKKEDAPIHIAVRSNDTDLIAAFLEHPVDLLIPGYRKRTPIHVIAESDNLEAYEVVYNMKEALLMQLRLCSMDEDDLTPIHLAARKGSYRVLDFMMCHCENHGYRVETVLSFLDEENSTPLHAAIDGGHTKVVEVLLKYGADPTVIKHDQPPPIHLACSQGKLEIVQAMVEHCGKDVLNCTDQYGRTPLHYCTHAINSSQVICYLARHGVDINANCNQSRTAIHTAITSGSLAAVQELLSNKADPLLKDKHGCNPLHYAVNYNRKAIVKCILELPCAPHLVTDTDNNGDSPVHCALKLGLGDLLPPMVSIAGSQLQGIADSDGKTYLHLAAKGGDWRALSILFNTPACQNLVNETNKCGITALHEAAAGGHVHCVEILLSQGAMSHKCYCGLTPFMIACMKGRSVCAKLLHEAHPYQKDWTDDEGNTGLHLAVRSGNPAVITLALDLGIVVTHNFEQESFLDLIIDRVDTNSAMAAVNHPRWQECLDLCSPLHPHPMLGLVIRMPGVAQAILDHCHTKASLNREHRDYWEEFDFKYLRLTHEPSDSAALGISEADEHDSMQPAMPAIRYKGSVRRLISRPKKKVHPMLALQKMVHYNRVSLLTHPVVEAYLKSKWRNYGRWFYYGVHIAFLLQVIFLSIFIVIAPNPATDTNSTPSSNSTGTDNSTLSTSANAVRIVTLILCTINSVGVFGAMLSLGLQAFNWIENTWFWTYGLSIILTFIFLIPTEPLWQAGALASFFAWFRLVLGFQFVGFFGIYISMFLAITQTVFQVLLLAFLFVLAFGLALYILAGTIPEFSTVGYSLFTNFGYMLGA